MCGCLIPDLGIVTKFGNWLPNLVTGFRHAVFGSAAEPLGPTILIRLEHLDEGVRVAALQTLNKLETAVLSVYTLSYTHCVIRKLSDFDAGVRVAALKVFHRHEIDAAQLAPHAAEIIWKLNDSDRSVRYWAMQTVDRMETAVLAQHAPAILASSFSGEDGGDVSVAALKVFQRRDMDASVLAQHAADIFARLEDRNAAVRVAAIRTLGKMDAEHTAKIVAGLKDSDAGVRMASAQILDGTDVELLAQHAAAIIARLEDSDRSLRRWAVQALSKMEMAMLMEHVPAIVARFGDSDEDVHGLACKLLYGEGGESDDKALDRSLKGGVSEGYSR